MKGTFLSLNENAKIFKELEKPGLSWWNQLVADKDFYIDIRKDNYINVYYYGGSVAKISYKGDFEIKVHQKYLGHKAAHPTKIPGVFKFVYEKISKYELISKLVDIKKCIEIDYLRHITGEKPAEKWLQGKLIIENPTYIDSEFQYNKDSKKIRIDLVELKAGVLSFVELKGITDSRLANDISKISTPSEIIEQMQKYQLFIERNATERIAYYKKFIRIKKNLRLLSLDETDFKLNKKPKLLIVDTYQKVTKGREARKKAIMSVLDENGIDYQISCL